MLWVIIPSAFVAICLIVYAMAYLYSVRHAVLQALLTGPRTAEELIGIIRTRTKGKLKPNYMLPSILRWLERQGMVDSYKASDARWRVRYFYRLTQLGAVTAAEEGA